MPWWFMMIFLSMPGPIGRYPYSCVARLVEKPASNQERTWWAESHQAHGVGLMIRESLAPGARFGMVMATLGRGLVFRGRAETDGEATIQDTGSGDENTQYPLYLRIRRAGESILGSVSADGKTFLPVGGSLVLRGLKGPVYVGFAVANGFEGFTTTGQFDLKSITLE